MSNERRSLLQRLFDHPGAREDISHAADFFSNVLEDMLGPDPVPSETIVTTGEAVGEKIAEPLVCQCGEYETCAKCLNAPSPFRPAQKSPPVETKAAPPIGIPGGFCEECGRSLRPLIKFCAGCGTRVPQ